MGRGEEVNRGMSGQERDIGMAEERFDKGDFDGPACDIRGVNNAGN